jgi:hypothetical protein
MLMAADEAPMTTACRFGVGWASTPVQPAIDPRSIRHRTVAQFSEHRERIARPVAPPALTSARSTKGRQ